MNGHINTAGGQPVKILGQVNLNVKSNSNRVGWGPIHTGAHFTLIIL